MSLDVLKLGIGTGLRDLGRWGLAADGVAPGGAMDGYSLKLLNALLENHPAEAALEILDTTARFVFKQDALFGISGADFSAFLNDKPLYPNARYQAHAGDVLFFGKRLCGNYLYLGVQQGFDVPIFKGSKGFHAGLGYVPTFAALNFQQSRGDTLIADRSFGLNPNTDIKYVSYGTRLNNLSIDPQSNRQAYILKNVEIDGTVSTLSQPVAKGTIQLLKDGTALVLMADHQTIGGYTNGGYISGHSLRDFAQSQFNRLLNFKEISVVEAENEQLKANSELRKLTETVRIISRF